MNILKLAAALMMFVMLMPELLGQNVTDREGVLTRKQAAIVAIAAFGTKGEMTPLSSALNEGLDMGLTVNEVKEVLVHLYAYAGFPRSLNAISNFEKVVKERELKGIRDPAGDNTSYLVSSKSKYQFGKDNLALLAGTGEPGAPQKFVPIIDTFLKEHLFADIFRRKILDFQAREIVTISALASLGGAEAQLRSHFNVGLNTGLTQMQLQDLVKVLETRVGTTEGKIANDVLLLVINKNPKTVGSNDTNVKAFENLASSHVSSNKDSIFPKGARMENGNFTGVAWVQMLMSADSNFNMSLGNVTFEPGSRTKWHYHPGGQLLLITSGRGRYQEKGQPVRKLSKGDVIKCSPNISHWHGAAPDSELTHVTIGPRSDDGPVVWLQAVTDEEYSR